MKQALDLDHERKLKEQEKRENQLKEMERLLKEKEQQLLQQQMQIQKEQANIKHQLQEGAKGIGQKMQEQLNAAAKVQEQALVQAHMKSSFFVLSLLLTISFFRPANSPRKSSGTATT